LTTSDFQFWQKVSPNGSVAAQSSTPDVVVQQFPPERARLQRLLRDAAILLPATRASLTHLDTTTGELVTVATLGSVFHETRSGLKQGITGWVATHGQPLLIPDVAQEPRYHASDGPAVGSLICAPVIDEQTILGTLLIASDRVAAFEQRSLAVLGTLTRYAALALRELRYHHQESLPTRQLSMIIDAARAITSLLGPREIFANIATGLHQIIEYDYAIIFSYDAVHDELQIMAGNSCSGTPLRNARVSMDDPVSLSVRVARNRRASLYSPAQVPTMGLITEAFLDGEELALLCVPLLSKETLRGVVTLARAKDFLPDELRLVTDVAPLIATAIENIELYTTVKLEEEQLAAIFAGTTDGICVVDNSLRVIRTNEAFARITRISVPTLVGSKCQQVFQNSNVLLSTLTAAVQLGRTMPLIEYETSERAGETPRQVLVSVAPITTTDGYHAIVVVRDITEIRELDRVKAQFLQMVSHDIRSPLHALNGYLDMALSHIGGTLSPAKMDLVRRARMSSKHLTARMRDLMVLAHADAGFSSLNMGPVDFHRVVGEAINEVKLQADEGHVTLHAPGMIILPPFTGDAERLEQVVRNLLSNAIKFTLPGGHITVNLDVRQNLIELSVTDTGCGVAQEHLPHIFERFYQAPPPQGWQRTPGQGLGLAIVKTIVEQHGGWVQVTSIPNQGTTFIACFPFSVDGEYTDVTL
jgi:PAS domain S-box-containing protein